jgi:hypothetical protein
LDEVAVKCANKFFATPFVKEVKLIMSKEVSRKLSWLKQHRGLVILLLLMLAWSWWYPGYRQEMTRRPLDAPITIVPPGELRTPIHIPLEEPYELMIGFDRTGRDFVQWRALLGYGPSVEKIGIPIMIRWELYEKSKITLIKSREVQTFGTRLWEKDCVFRVVDRVRVVPGEYEIVVKLMQDMPEITNPQGKVIMTLAPGIDMAETPELRLMSWIGLLMIEPLLWGIEIMLSLILIVKIVRGK